MRLANIVMILVFVRVSQNIKHQDAQDDQVAPKDVNFHNSRGKQIPFLNQVILPRNSLTELKKFSEELDFTTTWTAPSFCGGDCQEFRKSCSEVKCGNYKQSADTKYLRYGRRVNTLANNSIAINQDERKASINNRTINILFANNFVEKIYLNIFEKDKRENVSVNQAGLPRKFFNIFKLRNFRKQIKSKNSLIEQSELNNMIYPNHRLYSKWSRWTKCSPKCTTRRYKKCQINMKCDHEILREIAYCYTEGGFCQQWVQTKISISATYDIKPIVSTRHQKTAVNTFSKNINEYILNAEGYRSPEYMPIKLKCGTPPIRSKKKNPFGMLKIIGGKPARKGDWPWQVAIFNRFKEAFCGGTLIAPQWVLTAAHCVRRILYVRLGEHNLDEKDGTEIHLKVINSVKHPNFDKKTIDSDIALLRMPKTINNTMWVGFSCLPRPFQPLPKNLECTVIGWGKRRSRDHLGTSILHQANVPIVSMDNCRSVYRDYTITKNMFCAGHKRGRIDTCAGDSGGPLMCRDDTNRNHPWTIFGITSFGDGCAKRNKFGIYAKVSNYVDWIWSVINCNGNCMSHMNLKGST